MHGNTDATCTNGDKTLINKRRKYSNRKVKLIFYVNKTEKVVREEYMIKIQQKSDI